LQFDITRLGDVIYCLILLPKLSQAAHFIALHTRSTIVRKLLLTASLFGLPLLPMMAHATPTITVKSSLDLLDFTSLAGSGNPGLKNTNTFSFHDGSVTFINSSDLKSGVYQGSTPGVALSPYLGAHTDDHRNYLVAQANGTVNLFFDSPQTMFGLLWGSVDSYNELAFIGLDGTTTQSVRGYEIPGILYDGTQNAYVMISGLNPFTEVVAISHDYPAFEFVPDPVPEPRGIALLGLGLLGLGMVRHVTKRPGQTADRVPA
jgi:hypothetical protein